MRIHLKASARTGGLVGTTLGTLLVVVGPSPEGFVDRLAGSFDEGLTQEGWTLPAPMDPVLFAAAFGNRGDARVFL